MISDLNITPHSTLPYVEINNLKILLDTGASINLIKPNIVK